MVRLTSEELLKRFSDYAINCQRVTLLLSKTASNIIYSKQLIRSSSSPAANYIEAIEGFSRKEFIHRLKVARKETKESNYWLYLIKQTNKMETSIVDECDRLTGEGREMIKILASSIATSEINDKLVNKR